MYGYELTVDDAREGQQIKRVHKDLIRLLIVLVKTLILEVEEGCELPTLMVATQKENRVGVVDLFGLISRSTLMAYSRTTTSTEKDPRSTKSPRNRYLIGSSTKYTLWSQGCHQLPAT